MVYFSQTGWKEVLGTDILMVSQEPAFRSYGGGAERSWGGFARGGPSGVNKSIKII